MSYDDILELPLKVFTLYNTNINRLRAEEDIRTIRLLASVNSGEAVSETFSNLKDEMGKTVEVEGSEFVQPEEGAFEKLQSLANLR